MTDPNASASSPRSRPPATQREEALVGVVVILIVLVWAVIIAYAAHSAFPHNPVQLPHQNKAYVTMILPEGWAFFTRSPRDPRYSIYVQEDHHSRTAWRDASLTPFARPSHIFGLDRTARTQGLEFGLVTQHLTEEAWTSCTGDPTGCLDRIDFVGTIQNPALRPTLCGTVGFVLQRPVPWSWSTSDSPIHMPSSVVKLNVQCNHAS